MSNKFRATSGFDAGGQKIINVAKADRGTPSDAVNVDYFDDNNTVQVFSEDRPYNKEFIVAYQNKMYEALVDVAKGPFNPNQWRRIRVDTQWETVNETVTDGTILGFGTNILANSRFNTLFFLLPEGRVNGESVTIRDIGFQTGENPITVTSTTGSIVKGESSNKTIHIITTPGIESVFTYNQGAWYLKESTPSRKYYVSSGSIVNTQANDVIFKNSSTGLIELQLPTYANNGDVITMFDVDKKNATNHTKITVAPDSEHTIGTENKTEFISKTLGVTRLIYDSSTKNWKTWNGDLRGRITKTTALTYNISANETVFIEGRKSPTSAYTTNIILPTKVRSGDICTVKGKSAAKFQTITITATGSDMIVRNNNTLQFPRATDLPNTDWVKSKTLTIQRDSYSPTVELFYDEATGLWFVSDYNPLVERVDHKDRSRVGVIQLSTVEEAQVDKDQNPDKEKAITPETLAKRTATETRQGIARLATKSEVNQLSGSVYDDLTIITPKKLNERIATETMRGLAEIATQAEADSLTNDSVIITPKKLSARKASETLVGVLDLVKTGGTPGSSRGTQGSGVYAFNTNISAVTPKSLNELVATEQAIGLSFLATEQEVTQRTPPNIDPKRPIVVTAQTLEKKIAHEDRKGITQIATQPEVLTGEDDFKYITPKKLKKSQEVFVRKAGDVMTGKLSLNSPVAANLEEISEDAIPNEPQIGFWMSFITSKAHEYPQSEVQDSMLFANTGTLTNFGSSLDSITQIWTPTKGIRKFIRTGDQDGWSEWDEIYTKQNRPTPREISAISAVNGLTERLVVKDHLQIGNVQFKVNLETRSLDFVWLDDPTPDISDNDACDTCIDWADISAGGTECENWVNGLIEDKIHELMTLMNKELVYKSSITSEMGDSDTLILSQRSFGDAVEDAVEQGIQERLPNVYEILRLINWGPEA